MISRWERCLRTQYQIRWIQDTHTCMSLKRLLECCNRKVNAASWMMKVECCKLKVESRNLNVECWKKVCELVRLWVWELVSLGVWDSEGVKACCLVGAHTNYIAVQPAGDPGLRQGVLTHDHTWPQEKGGDKLTIFFAMFNLQITNNAIPPSPLVVQILTTQFEWFNLMFIIALKSHDVHYCIEIFVS